MVGEEFALDAFVSETLDVQGEGDDNVATQTNNYADKSRPARRIGGRVALLYPDHRRCYVEGKRSYSGKVMERWWSG